MTESERLTTSNGSFDIQLYYYLDELLAAAGCVSSFIRTPHYGRYKIFTESCVHQGTPRLELNFMRRVCECTVTLSAMMLDWTFGIWLQRELLNARVSRHLFSLSWLDTYQKDIEIQISKSEALKKLATFTDPPSFLHQLITHFCRHNIHNHKLV